MGCVADTLRCMLFMSLEDNHIDVHKQCSLIRVITAISRVVGKIDFMQRLCLDLISLNRPLKVSQLPLLQAVAGVWPLVLARKVCVYHCLFCFVCTQCCWTKQNSKEANVLWQSAKWLYL